MNTEKHKVNTTQKITQSKSKTTSEKVSDYIDYIDDLMFNDCMDEALKLVIKSKFLFPSNQEISKREADIYFKKEQYDRAFQIFDLLKAQENSSKRDLCLAIKMMNEGFLKEAKEIAAKLSKSKEVDISSRAYTILADLCFLDKNYKAMYRWSREALKRNAFIDSFADKFYLSIVLTNNYSKSLPFLESTLDENPYSAKLWLYTGQTYLKLGFKTQAIESFEMALCTDENLVEAKNQLEEVRGF